MYFTILLFYFALNGIVIFSFLLLLKNGVFWWRHQNRFSWIQDALSNFKKANQFFIERYVIFELFTQKSFCPSYLSQKIPVTPGLHVLCGKKKGYFLHGYQLMMVNSLETKSFSLLPSPSTIGCFGDLKYIILWMWSLPLAFRTFSLFS